MIHLGYAGRLAYFEPESTKDSGWAIRDYLWTYQVKNLDLTTRSGYYIFQAIKELQEKKTDIADQLKFSLWGSIDEGHATLAEKLNIRGLVDIGGYASKKETRERLKKMDVLFLPLESSRYGQRPLFIPGKLYEYLQLGKPIFALAEPSDCRDILEKSGLALIANPKDVDEIAEKLEYLIKNQDDLNKLFVPDEAYIQQFDFRNLTGELAGIFRGGLYH